MYKSKRKWPKLKKSRHLKLKWNEQYVSALNEMLFSTKNDCTFSKVLSSNKKNLANHYVCGQCDDRFQFQSSLEDHLARFCWILGYWCSEHLPTQEKLEDIEEDGEVSKAPESGTVLLFYNQCQFLEHLNANEINSVDINKLMLMPVPHELQPDECSQLEVVCKILMKYMFIHRIHIMDWLRLQKIDFKWWKIENFNHIPLANLLKEYNNYCNSNQVSYLLKETPYTADRNVFGNNIFTSNTRNKKNFIRNDSRTEKQFNLLTGNTNLPISIRNSVHYPRVEMSTNITGTTINKYINSILLNQYTKNMKTILPSMENKLVNVTWKQDGKLCITIEKFGKVKKNRILSADGNINEVKPVNVDQILIQKYSNFDKITSVVLKNWSSLGLTSEDVLQQSTDLNFKLLFKSPEVTLHGYNNTDLFETNINNSLEHTLMDIFINCMQIFRLNQNFDVRNACQHKSNGVFSNDKMITQQSQQSFNEYCQKVVKYDRRPIIKSKKQLSDEVDCTSTLISMNRILRINTSDIEEFHEYLAFPSDISLINKILANTKRSSKHSNLINHDWQPKLIIQLLKVTCHKCKRKVTTKKNYTDEIPKTDDIQSVHCRCYNYVCYLCHLKRRHLRYDSQIKVYKQSLCLCFECLHFLLSLIQLKRIDWCYWYDSAKYQFSIERMSEQTKANFGESTVTINSITMNNQSEVNESTSFSVNNTVISTYYEQRQQNSNCISEIEKSITTIKIRPSPKPWRIALNGPNKYENDPVNYKCHLCGVLISTCWQILKNHFNDHHSQHYKLAVMTPELSRISPETLQITLANSDKKRKSDVNSFTPKKKTRWAQRQIVDKSISSNLGICVQQESFQEYKLKCKKCHHHFNDINILREHLALNHRLQRNFLICLECGENFVAAPSLQMHLKAFHGIQDPINYMSRNTSYAPDASDEIAAQDRLTKSNQCYVCMEVFESKIAVDKHLRVHGMAFLNRRRIEAQNALKHSKTMSVQNTHLNSIDVKNQINKT